MKVKNIMFSGFMAVVLAGVCGAASAAEMTGDALVVASKGYVDAKLGSVNTELSNKITALEDANKEGGDVAIAIADAKQAGIDAQNDVDELAGKMNLDSADSDLSKALATKENTANKIATTDSTYFTDGKVADGALTSMASDNTKFPTVAAAVEIADAKAQQVVKDINETAGNLGELKSTVDKLVANDQTPGSVAYQIKAEADRATGEEGRIEGLVTAEKERAEGVEEGLQNAIDDINDETNGILAQANDYTDTEVSGLETKLMDDTNGTVTAAIKAETQRAELAEQANAQAITNLTNGTVKDNADAIEKLNGGASTEGSVDYKVLALENKLMDETNGTVTAAIKVEEERAKLAEKANADAITGLTNGAVKDNTDAIAEINDEQNGIFAKAKEYTNAGLATLYSNASECITKSKSKHCIMSAHADDLGNPVYVWIDLTAPAN